MWNEVGLVRHLLLLGRLSWGKVGLLLKVWCAWGDPAGAPQRMCDECSIAGY